MAKAAHKSQMAPKELPVLTREQMVAEIRNLRAGKLFVGNMEFIDALLAAHDEAQCELLALRPLKAIEMPAGQCLSVEFTHVCRIPEGEIRRLDDKEFLSDLAHHAGAAIQEMLARIRIPSGQHDTTIWHEGMEK